MGSQKKFDMGQNINNTFNEREALKEVKEKKKKHKDAEKSKKKKHKTKNGERFSEMENIGQNGTGENINLWLEDVTSQTELNCNDADGVGSKAKKSKKKHKKQSKDKKKECSSEVLQTRPPKKQCLVDSNDVKLDCYLEADVNPSENYNVRLTFLCKNTHNDFPLNEVEIKLEGGQQVSVVGSNPIRSKILPQSIQNEHCCLKVSCWLGMISEKDIFVKSK